MKMKTFRIWERESQALLVQRLSRIILRSFRTIQSLKFKEEMAPQNPPDPKTEFFRIPYRATIEPL